MIQNGFSIPTIKDTTIENKRVVVRVDFDVSLQKNKIADDTRIQQSIPTLEYLLKNHNKLILISKLNRPKQRDEEHSLKHVIPDFKKYLPNYTITLVDDFLSEISKSLFDNQTEKEILLLENIRFYPEEESKNLDFAKKMASLGDVFVSDAFSMLHRKDQSVVGIPHFLPSFAGLLVEKEVNDIFHLLENPKKPVVAIMGGAKIPDKLAFVSKLIQVADYLLVGGGIANTMLFAKGNTIGKSICEKEEKPHVEQLFRLAKEHKTEIVLPADVIGIKGAGYKEELVKATEVPEDFAIYDIGPETEALFGNIIANANTIIWNGPVGYFEKPPFDRGTDFLYYAITQNSHAYSIVGGGDTLAAISKKEYVDKISHISTGGGAMLELIEKGTLPGLEALKRS